MEILRGLDAPGISRPIELTTVGGSPALVVEDAGQRNLAEALGGRPLALETFLDLAVRMARILHEVHARSVIHGDISPENFILDERGAVTLVDFESATTVPAFPAIPEPPGTLNGSLAYMSPEQFGRLKRLVDRRSDLYALGATFYEMLTGHPPFRTSDPLELVHAHAARAPYPPAIVNHSVPTAVSDLVVKLLAKMPEWRYQTAQALVADLEEARRQWRARGRIEPFELGRLDMPYGLWLAPERLYGRERETALLQDAVERAKAGGSEVVLVTGPAGVGKSALVAHVRDASEAGARWISGKGDLLQGNLPLAPLGEAFRELVQVMLREPEADVAALRERLRAATAPNCSVLTEAIPDLKALLGDQPPAPAVGAVEEENRLHLVFSAFMRALLAEGPPLVLFLDDLQWMDAASLKLVRSLATDPDLSSLLIVCAYRSDEVGPDHPVAQAIDAMRAGDARVTPVQLEPLDPDSLLALLCDSLRAEPSAVGPLAAAVRRKTAANPFFVRQFLGYLYRRQLLVFDAQAARWSWDLPGIEASDVAPNMVDLLSRVLETLPAEAQGALQAAACIGNRFELSLLAGARGESMGATARALWAPVQQGLIVPAAEGERFPWVRDKPVELETAPTYRFVHDRIQQAAYASLSGDARRAIHLSIGRWLEAHVPEASFEKAVGAIADQLDRAVDQLPEGERVRLADLNERAGRQARATASYSSALCYFEAGRALLPAEAWRGEPHGLWFALQRGAAESAGLTGEHERCERLVDEGVSRTDLPLEKAGLFAVSVQANALRGAHQRAIQRAREGLAVLGMELPEVASSKDARAEQERTQASVGSRSDRQLLEAHAMADPLDRARLQLLVLLSSSWFTSPELFQVVACLAAGLTARSGIGPGSAVAYAYYAIARALAGEYREAYRYGRLAAELAERRGNPSEESRVLLCLGGHVSAWHAPIEESFPILQRSHARALESGDLEFASYALTNLVFTRMLAGAELDQSLAETESTLAFLRKIQNRYASLYMQPLVQAIRCLKGLTRSRASFEDDGFDEARFLEEAKDNGLAQATFHIFRVKACYLLGELELAWTYLARSAPWIPSMRTIFLRSEHDFYAALILAEVGPQGHLVEKDAALAKLRERLARLEIWAENAPMNFAHRRDLVAAELARLEGREADAQVLYHGAIEQAGGAGFVHDEALANELCGRYHRARGAGQMADVHLEAALEGYWRWGAPAKVDLVEQQLSTPRPGRRLRRATTPAAPPALDALSLIRAVETLTEELELERLLPKLVRTCAEAANAQRAVLALDEGGLVIRATLAVPSEVVLERRPLAVSPAAPRALIEQVLGSREVVVLGDASREGRFAADPYLSAGGVRSVLAVPITRATRALGVLYFENNLASDAFTPERVELLRLLSAPVAIAIENSRLFEERRRSEAALRILSRAGTALAETLDYDQVLSKIGALTVPALADWCVLDVLEAGVLSPVAWAHADPSAAPQVEELHRLYPVNISSQQPQLQAVRSGLPLLVPEVTEEMLRTSTRDERHMTLLRMLNPRSVIICPLVARGRTIGVLTLASSHPTRRYDASDLALARELCRRIGLALDNARLHRDLQGTVRQLARSERRLGEAQRVAHVGSFEWDVRPNRVTWSDELHRIYGLEPGQFDGSFEGFLKRVHPDDLEPTRSAVLKAFQTGGPFEYQHRIVRADRRIRILFTRGDVIKGEDGRTVRLVGTCWDITELTEATEARERSLSMLQATIEATADGILVVDRDQKVVISNERFLEMWRIPPELAAFTGREPPLEYTMGQVEDPEELQRDIDAWRAQPEQERTRLIRFRDGRVFELYARPQRVGDAVVGAVLSFRDISERERLLRNALFLTDASRLLASLDVEQALDAVAHLAVPLLGDGCAIDLFEDGAPRRLVEVSGDPSRPALPELHPIAVHGPSIAYELEGASFLGAPMMMKDQVVGALTLRAAPQRHHTQDDVDLVEELARRAALAIDNARLYRQAQGALRARDELLAVAAHEIKGPVTAIHLAVQSIRKAKVPLQSVPRLLDLIEKEDRRLKHFVDELLDLGRIRSGTLRLEYQDVDLAEVVQDVVARLGPQISASGSKVTVEIRGSAVGRWDRFRLDQVVSNLISNALKFGLGKPIEIEVHGYGPQVSFAVRDHGIGMEPELQERAFKPFERGVSVRHYGGLGLGLHIVKTIVEALGGSVSVESEPGAGSTFRVEFPRSGAETGPGAHPDGDGGPR